MKELLTEMTNKQLILNYQFVQKSLFSAVRTENLCSKLYLMKTRINLTHLHNEIRERKISILLTSNN